MPEQGRGLGESFFGKPRGEPDKPMLEALLVLFAFYLAAYISTGGPGIQVAKPAFQLGALALNVTRAIFALYLMATSDGLPSFGIRRPKRRDAAKGLLCALAAFALVLATGIALSSFGLENPLFAQVRSAPRASLGLIPLFLASSMSTGYCEELFFRSYLMRRLGQAGLPPLWAALASSLLFAAGHGYQGAVGLIAGFILGLFFAWRWNAGAAIHEIAIGHGLFDACAFAILLYS